MCNCSTRQEQGFPEPCKRRYVKLLFHLSCYLRAFFKIADWFFKKTVFLFRRVREKLNMSLCVCRIFSCVKKWSFLKKWSFERSACARCCFLLILFSAVLAKKMHYRKVFVLSWSAVKWVFNRPTGSDYSKLEKKCKYSDNNNKLDYI